MLMQVGGSWSQTTGTRRLRRAFGRQREVLDLERCVGFETDDVATITQVKERATSRAYQATFEAILIEIHGTKMLAIAAILPLDLNRTLGLAFEVELTE
jgi:hypothetical protein